MLENWLRRPVELHLSRIKRLAEIITIFSAPEFVVVGPVTADNIAIAANGQNPSHHNIWLIWVLFLESVVSFSFILSFWVAIHKDGEIATLKEGNRK